MNLLEKIREYHMPQEAQELLKAHPPLLIAGMSSVGKNTVAKYIVEHSDYRRVITHTTRQPREGEVNGRDYWFINESEIAQMVDQQSLIEVQLVHEEDVYGTSIESYEVILEAGFHPLLIADVYGALKFTNFLPQLRPFFIIPPSFEVWMERWNRRGAMTYAEKARRLRSASTELEKAIRGERFILIINYEIPSTVSQILSGVIDPSTQRRNREAAQQLLDHLKVN